MSKTFPIRVGLIWSVLLLLLGVIRSQAWVRVEEQALSIRFGFFRYRIPWSEIAGAEARDWPFYYGIGLRVGADQTLALIGSTQGVVSVRFTAPRQMKMPFPMPFLRVAISMEDPQGLIDAIEAVIRED